MSAVVLITAGGAKMLKLEGKPKANKRRAPPSVMVSAVMPAGTALAVPKAAVSMPDKRAAIDVKGVTPAVVAPEGTAETKTAAVPKAASALGLASSK